MSRPNIILICADQWRSDCLSIAGHSNVRTPYLDSLANTGVRFTNAYSATPTCVPARMALMTGLSQSQHRRVGYQDGVQFDIEETLARQLKGAGYQTQAIGKMHYWPERTRAGFDDVLLHDGYLHHSRDRSRPVEFYDDYLPWLREQAGVSAVADYLDNGLDCNSMVARPWDLPEHLHPTNWVVSEAIRWMYRRESDLPFLLYLSFHRPHAPYDPPAWAFEQYLHHDLEPPVQGDWAGDYAPFRDDHNPSALVANYPPDSIHRARAGYYGHISHIDQQISRFVQALKEFGAGENTYVCFISDHGDMLGDHGLWRKGYPYEASAGIPFILQGPGIPAGHAVEAIVELRDVMPTLLELAGAAIPSRVEGQSLVPLWQEPEEPEEPEALGGTPAPPPSRARDYLHGEHALLGHSLQWIRAGEYKYVWFSDTGHEQLFNIADDPSELRDLARHSPDHPQLHVCRNYLREELTGREEGYVQAGRLVPGRPAQTLLSTPRQHAANHSPPTTDERARCDHLPE